MYTVAVTVSVNTLPLPVSLGVVYYLFSGLSTATIDADVVSMVTGMYFACIMMMCSLSVVFTVLVLNLHYRSPHTHRMPVWVTS